MRNSGRAAVRRVSAASGPRDNFTDGDPAEFLKNLNDHMPCANKNDLIFIEGTGHTDQMKHYETAEAILTQLKKWF